MALNRNTGYVTGSTVNQTGVNSAPDTSVTQNLTGRVGRTAPDIQGPEAGRIDSDVDVVPNVTPEQEARETRIENSAPFTYKNVEMALRELSDNITTENLWNRVGTTLEPNNAGDGIDVADATLGAGATINEFSTDATLAGNSNTAVPTERAVKTYVDGAGVWERAAGVITPKDASNVDIDSGAGYWFRPPVMTTAERNIMTAGFAAADRGKIWMNSTNSQLEMWNGAAIVILG